MENKEYPLVAILVCSVAVWMIVERATGRGILAFLAAATAFFYLTYLYMIYTEKGKHAMLSKLKEHAFLAVFMLVLVVGSIWLTGVIAGWLGAESIIAKLGLWMLVMLLVTILELCLVLRKR